MFSSFPRLKSYFGNCCIGGPWLTTVIELAYLGHKWRPVVKRLKCDHVSRGWGGGGRAALRTSELSHKYSLSTLKFSHPWAGLPSLKMVTKWAVVRRGLTVLLLQRLSLDSQQSNGNGKKNLAIGTSSTSHLLPPVLKKKKMQLWKSHLPYTYSYTFYLFFLIFLCRSFC